MFFTRQISKLLTKLRDKVNAEHTLLGFKLIRFGVVIMKNKVTQKWLIASVCLFIPITYAAEPEDINLNSIDQFYSNKPSSLSKHEYHASRSDDVQIIQQGNYNQATVDVSGKSNQLSLIQEGNRNKGDIQLDGDRNKILASQEGNNAGFALKVEGDNRTYILTQQKRR